MKMKACENHNESIVIFNEETCPFCMTEKKLKTIREEIDKSMAIMRQIQLTVEGSGSKPE